MVESGVCYRRQPLRAERRSCAIYRHGRRCGRGCLHRYDDRSEHCSDRGTLHHARNNQPRDRLLDEATAVDRAATVAVHPRYNAQSIAAHRATADVALLRLSAPLPGKSAALLGVPRVPFSPMSRFTVVGIGSTAAGSDSGVGTARAAPLAVTGQPGTLQVRLVDPQTQNKAAGMGACTGDSGAPAFEDQDGHSVIVGVVSWSTGANNSAGCGGLTGVTPLTLYKDWIVKTARSWGAAIP